MAQKPDLLSGHMAETSPNDTWTDVRFLVDGIRTSDITHHSKTNSSENTPLSVRFLDRLEDLKKADRKKNSLLEELVIGYTLLEQKYNELAASSKQDLALATQAVAREKQVRSEFDNLVNLLDRDGFIIVLIDGNDLVFNDNLLRAGKEGGKRAAEVLATRLHNWAVEHVYDCPGDAKLAIRVFADVKGIAYACLRSGIITSPEMIHDFVRGFCGHDPLFDFMDVGAGKDMVRTRIHAVLQLHLHDYHCRHIFLGCNRDIKYASLLQQYGSDEEVLRRVALLQGPPLESSLAQLPLSKVAMPLIFRQQGIMPAGPATSHESPPRFGKSLNPKSEAFSPVRAIHSETPTQRVEHAKQARLLQTEEPVASPHTRLARTGSFTSSTASSDLPNGISTSVSNWSKVASKAAALPFKDLTRPIPTVKPSVPHIMQNKNGQRIDVAMPYDHERVSEVKKKKYCNQHYIGRGCCHWQAENGMCPHRHDENLSKEDLKWLRVVARETVCRRGVSCEEIDCIYGHSCPYPKKDDGPLCTNGPSCRFPSEMHGMDTKVAKYLTAASLKA